MSKLLETQNVMNQELFILRTQSRVGNNITTTQCTTKNVLTNPDQVDSVSQNVDQVTVSDSESHPDTV